MKKIKYEVFFEVEHTGNTEMEVEGFMEDAMVVLDKLHPKIKVKEGGFRLKSKLWMGSISGTIAKSRRIK